MTTIDIIPCTSERYPDDRWLLTVNGQPLMRSAEREELATLRRDVMRDLLAAEMHRMAFDGMLHEIVGLANQELVCLDDLA